MSLGIYVHLPFCRAHCTYCAFAVSTDLRREEAYVDALVREIERAPGAGGTNVTTLYFGGGTPSRTSPAHLRRVTEALRRTFDLATDAEFSMEANPEDVRPESLALWGDLGVTRLSIGVQSFSDAELAPLGRAHGAEQAREAVSVAVAAGFRTNLDLILGLPVQTPESFAATLSTAMALGVGHVSLYMLDLEEGSPLAVQVGRGRVELPEDSLVADLYVDAVWRLSEGGLRQYEISNFARPGEECRHNLRYWTREPYRGFGVGAHSFSAGRRFANTRDIRRYIDASPNAVVFEETLSEDDVRRETLFLQLRQSGGIDYEELARLCGQEGMAWMEQGLKEGWLRSDRGRVAFSPAGFLLSNEYISQLF